MLLSNLTVADGSPLTVSATQSVEFEIDVAPNKGFTVNAIALDVRTPSDTLEVTVKLEDEFGNVLTYSGSVTTAGWQTFTYDGNVLKWPVVRTATSRLQFLITIEGSGAGSIELEAASNQGSDPGSVSGLAIYDEPTRGGKVPTAPPSGSRGSDL